MDKPYGCHNKPRAEGYYSPQRSTPDLPALARVFIPNVMSKECRYDQRQNDPQCQGCTN